MITAKRLKELFSYDPETGLFTRRVYVSPNAQVGYVVAGCITKNGYRTIRVDGKAYYAHRLAWLYAYGKFPKIGMDLDHINCNKSDNRLINLRMATRVENSRNRDKPAHNTSGHRGVSYYKSRNRWVASITINGKHKNLGYFGTKEAAIVARIEGEMAHYKQFRSAA